MNCLRRLPTVMRLQLCRLHQDVSLGRSRHHLRKTCTLDAAVTGFCVDRNSVRVASRCKVHSLSSKPGQKWTDKLTEDEKEFIFHLEKPDSYHDEAQARVTDIIEGLGASATDTEWEDVRKQLSAVIPVVDTKLMYGLAKQSKVDLGKSFMSYLRRTDKPAVAVEIMYLKLLATDPQKFQDLMLEEYKTLCLREEFVYMTTYGVRLIVQSLATTDYWLVALDLLQNKALKSFKDHSNYYGPVIKAALREADVEKAFSMLEVVLKARTLSVDTERGFYVASKYGLFPVKKILDFMQRHESLPSEQVFHNIAEAFASERQGLKVVMTTVGGTNHHQCPNCKRPLQTKSLSRETFAALRKDFVENEFSEKDAYNFSSPAEVREFKKFVKENGPFDVVVDALNVSHEKGGIKRDNLAVLADELRGLGKESLLIVSRKHLAGIVNTCVKKAKTKTSAFFVKDNTNDDKFLVYAALASGPHCWVVSNDRLAANNANLKDISTFCEWQQLNQVYGLYMGRITKLPLGGRVTIQEHKNGWHIPLLNVRDEVMKKKDLRERFLSDGLDYEVMCVSYSTKKA